MINLLPPQEKEVLLEERRYKLVLILGVLILFSLIALSLVLLSVKLYVSGQKTAQKIFVDLEKKELSQLQPLQKEMLSFNTNFSNLNLFYQSQNSVTAFLNDLSSDVVPGVYLTNLSISSYKKNGSKVEISGFSKTRKNLSDFRMKLENDNKIKNVYFPLSSWIKLDNINFKANFVWAP